jgi:mannan endo-1,4-beta-mannosidase
MFGWSEYQSLSSAPDAEEHNAKHGTYVDFFLASLRELESKHGRRLVHALDVHWYPEARGTKRITDDDASQKTIDARLQAPRSLWDPEYRERSWIAEQISKPIRLLRWLGELVDRRYPGTELAMTEYNYGAPEHVSGGLAQADVLGVFGREGVYLANYWGKGAGVGPLPPYVAAAFKLYRNYDGKGGRFGDTAVQATSTDLEAASVFAATDSENPGALTVVVINKHQQKRFDGELRLGGPQRYSRARSFRFDGSGPELKPGAAADIEDNVLRAKLPPLSATLFVCERG